MKTKSADSGLRVPRRGHRAGRWVSLSFTALACTVAMVSAAWACTVHMGPLTLTPTSGRPGTVVTTSAQQLKAASTYKMVFNTAVRVREGRTCHSAPTILKTGIITNSVGSFSGVKVTIPSTAPRGLSELCAIETSPVAGSTASTHTGFTVL